MLSRRALLGGIAGGSGLVAGCLGTEDVGHCSSEGLGSGSQHLRRVAPIEGDEQVALGVLVSEEAAAGGAGRAVTIRDRDGDLVTTIPLSDNRDMSELDPDDYSIFTSEEGELYAVPLGRPPVHGEYAVALIAPNGEERATVRLRFNCYAADGTLP
jgi:hypothetical protein